jgi:hypothetical protein
MIFANRSPPTNHLRDSQTHCLMVGSKGDWKRAHESAQQGEGVEGSWVHAYLPRKEGDQGNAAYWYGRAGKPVLPTNTQCGMGQHRERFAGIEAPAAHGAAGSLALRSLLLARPYPRPPQFLSCGDFPAG